MSDADPKPAPKPTLRRQVLTALSWALAPILATGAVFLQFHLEVPTGEMIPRDDPKKPKARPPKPPTEARARRGWEARSPERLAVLRESWANQDIADEPFDNEFRQRHESLIRAAVSAARNHTVGTELVSIQARPVCHMIRCEVSLCGPAAPVKSVGDALGEVRRRNGRTLEPLWLEFRELESHEEALPVRPNDSAAGDTEDTEELEDSEGIEEPETPSRLCREWVVSFAADDVSREQVVWPEEPKKPDGKGKLPNKSPNKGKPRPRGIEPR